MRHAVVVLCLWACCWIGGCGEGGSKSCLERVPAAPDGAFATWSRLPDGRGRISYRDGSTLEIPARIKRVVTAVPGITEAWVWLDGAKRLVGASPHCDHPVAVLEEVPRVPVLPLDIERLLALEPDLVIVDRTLFRAALPELERMVPGVLALETSRSLPHLEHSLDLLARVVDTPEARTRVARWRRRMTGLLERLPREASPSVLLVGQWQPTYAIGEKGLLGDLLRACGARNVACDLRHASGPFSEELVLARRPDWLLATPGPLPAALKTRWDVLDAVREGRVASAKANDLVRGGPRILTGLSRLSAVLSGALPPERLAEEGLPGPALDRGGPR